jgi:hypothetical protein
MLQFGQQVSGAADTPLVRLFGQSPAGLNSTGESDQITYKDGVKRQQEANLSEPMTRLTRVVFKSEVGTDPLPDYDFEFVSLHQMSEKEKAEVADITTKAVALAVDTGLCSTATGMTELKQSSAETGIFDSITQEEIDDAENDAPPLPEVVEPEVEVVE